MAKKSGDTGTYRVTEIIGTSKISWEEAAKSAVETAAQSLHESTHRRNHETRFAPRRQRQGRGLSRPRLALVQIRPVISQSFNRPGDGTMPRPGATSEVT